MTTHTPRKRFSQNFLKNKHIIERIVQAIDPKVGEHLVEIGPGLGALTQYILPKVGEMDAIELDRDLIAPLTEACHSLGKLTIHSADALRFDFTTLTQERHSLRIVGNLPYQISTPLLFHLVEQVHLIHDLHFMLQKEVVERMAAKTHTKAYGRLSVMIQYHFDVKPLFLVPNTAFYPIPKVTSQIVRLTPTARKTVASDYNKFAEIVKQAFNYRRKTLHNSLRDRVDTHTLSRLGIDPNSRPEQLTVEDFIKISSR
jgi:16S rRNA (adenine1518-N6/adenine1519-N6)-dimethyltransferase